MKHLKRFLPFSLIILFLIIHLLIINDYGLTWDFHHHFFAGAKILGKSWDQVDPRPLPYTNPDPRTTAIIPYGPFVQLIPTASMFLFHNIFSLLPEDAAYHLPIVLSGILGLLFLFFFMNDAFGYASGILAVVFLGLTPRFFSDMHNNMKDVPSASIIALNICLIYRYIKKPTVTNILIAAFGFAIAFNTKINSIFIPIIFFLSVTLLAVGNILSNVRRSVRMSFTKQNRVVSGAQKMIQKHRKGILIFLLYILVSGLSAYLLWFFLWGKPITQFSQQFILSFVQGVDNLEVLLHGVWYCAGKNVPWFYSLWYLAITTPLPILILFFLGVVVCMKRWLLKNDPSSLLLLLWFFVPLSRYILPRTGVIDGVRHFEEVLFPLSAIASVGAITMGSQFLKWSYLTKRIRIFMVWIVIGLILVFLMAINVISHPFQITYFNELVGGIRGAQGKYDLDYWGGSQKYAIDWINRHVPKNASVTIAMAADVASRYLRPDLISAVNSKDYENADWVVILNRQSFFYRYKIVPYILTHTPVTIIENQGVPLVWVYDNRTPKVSRKPQWWTSEDPCIIW